MYATFCSASLAALTKADMEAQLDAVRVQKQVLRSSAVLKAAGTLNSIPKH